MRAFGLAALLASPALAKDPAPPAQAAPAPTAPRATGDPVVRVVAPGTLAQIAAADPVDPAAAVDSKSKKEAPEEMVVTGSRIERSNLNGVGPLSVISSDEIALSGASSLDQLLRKLPSVGFQGLTENDNNGGEGLATIDLRNLGSPRTLVLLDGRRFPVSSSQVEDAVDINNIPMALIDRIEVLRDGASAVYGADAVAGVINFVLKDKFEGMQFDVETGASQRGDGETSQLSFTGGRQFGAANLIFNASYLDKNGIEQHARRFSKKPITSINGSNEFVFGSSAIPEGRVESEDGLVFFRPTSDGTNASFQPLVSRNLDQRFDFAKDSFMVPPLNRLSLNALGNYEFNDSVQAYVQTTYTKRNSRQRMASTPLGLSGTINNPQGLLVPLSQFPDDFQNAVSGGTIALPGLDPTTQLVPVARRLQEVGPRIIEQDVQTTRFVAGLKGEVDLMPLGPWKWDTFFNYGRTNTSTHAKNSVDLTRANQAADPVVCATIPGCVPGNFIGAGSLNRGTVDFIKYNEHDQLRFHLKDFGVSTTGPLFELPFGVAQIAIGGEYRREDGFFKPSEIKRRGDSANNQTTPTRGGFSTREAFWELQLPLVSGKPFFDELSANLAGRLTDYSTFGSDYLYRYALVWAPSREYRFRATWSTSFRAPGVTDLFGGNTDDFAFLDDPCTDFDSIPEGNLRANCSQAGVGSGFTQTDSQIRRTIGGNPKLEAETSRFFGMGLVWTPEFIPELSLTTDFYAVEINNAIENPDSQFLLNACYNGSAGLSDPACAVVSRNPTDGKISRLEASIDNIGRVKTRGLDFELRYGFRMPVLGDVAVNWGANYLMDYTQTLPTGKIKLNGMISPDNGNIANFKAAMTTTFKPMEKLFFTTNLRFIGSADTGEEGRIDKVPGVWYLDLAASYDLNETWSIAMGLRNAMDRVPPRFIQEDNTNPASYDLTGRFGYVRLTGRF